MNLQITWFVTKSKQHKLRSSFFVKNPFSSFMWLTIEFLYFLPNPGRILPVLTFNGCDPFYVNAGRIQPWFGRKLRNIGKVEWIVCPLCFTTTNDIIFVNCKIPHGSNKCECINCSTFHQMTPMSACADFTFFVSCIPNQVYTPIYYLVHKCCSLNRLINFLM